MLLKTRIFEVNTNSLNSEFEFNLLKNNFEGLEKLLFDMDASFKKREASSQALIVRLSIENEQLKEDLSAVEQV